MKIFERIREIFSSKEEEIVEPMREINGIPGLENDIGIKKKEIGEKKGEIKKEVRGRIERFCPDLEEAVRVLREKDISEKKEHEKIKTIVNENLNLYIGYTERLIENLKAVEEEDGRNYLNKVLKVLQDFKMQSFKAFEKTTLLIGKEMEDTKRMIREFTNELNGFFERNRKIFEQEDRIKSIESYILILKDIENSESQIDEEIKNFEDEFEQFKEAKLNLETNLESIEKSKEHERDMEKKRKRGEELKEVERQIEITKSQIDIKKLARQFYKNPANNALLKNYSNNFLSGLRGDEELRIIEIVDSGQNLDVSELRGLRERLIELEIPLITGSDEKIESIEKELKILESKIAVMNSNREIEVKKKERVKERKERLLGEISKEAEEVFPGVKLTFTSRN